MAVVAVHWVKELISLDLQLILYYGDPGVWHLLASALKTDTKETVLPYDDIHLFCFLNDDYSTLTNHNIEV